MSSFVEIQEHIRAHGSVISRIIVYDDFQRNLTARPAFGHAVVLVGYDNENYTWTAMNSWGQGPSTLLPYQPGVTADGLFRIQMGIGGVGTPEQTYGITCTATEQHKLATVNTQPWEQERRAVAPDSAAVALDTLASCYRYKFVKGDTVASIVSWSGVPIQNFTQTNWKMFGGLQDVKFSFASKLAEADIRNALQSVAEVTRDITNNRPFFTCLTYTESGEAANVTCYADTTARCAGLGVAACTLHYKDVNVTDTLPVGSFVRLCDSRFTIPGEFDKVAFVSDNKLLQQRALISILNLAVRFLLPGQT
ncbi:hypothetical protein OEZ85_011706 [Tetradesmus obliquus]|uniref:Peptidase C1A papain C-terminal domain-containing protein n=1 Tax=Tetradesmus obliquus TaxID=3088 RepID=A0ABY8TTJ8_TETOB|nr:hypothetical protein OEZ85_011706 [Tetradesmus obliquus]